MRALGRVQGELSEGRLPTGSLLSGAAVLVGGAFLLTPGVITDLAGFCLLLPPTRKLAFRWAQARMNAALTAGALSASVWNMGRWAGPSGASPKGKEGGSGPHGRGTGLPFDFGSRAEEGRRDHEEEDRGPRPGEIIQD